MALTLVVKQNSIHISLARASVARTTLTAHCSFICPLVLALPRVSSMSAVLRLIPMLLRHLGEFLQQSQTLSGLSNKLTLLDS